MSYSLTPKRTKSSYQLVCCGVQVSKGTHVLLGGIVQISYCNKFNQLRLTRHSKIKCNIYADLYSMSVSMRRFRFVRDCSEFKLSFKCRVTGFPPSNQNNREA